MYKYALYGQNIKVGKISYDLHGKLLR